MTSPVWAMRYRSQHNGAKNKKGVNARRKAFHFIQLQLTKAGSSLEFDWFGIDQ